MPDLTDPPLGSIVTVAGLGFGVVRFKGQTAFRPGKWIGVELQEKKGKNDGSVEGTVYFKCEPLFGVFVPPSKIQAIHGSELEATPTKASVTAARRSSMAHQRTLSSSGAGLLRTKPPSSVASSNPSTRSASPAKPTAQPSLSRSVSIRGAPSPTKPSSSISLQPRRSFVTRQSPSQEGASSNGVLSPPMKTQTSQSGPFTAKRTSSPLSQSPLIQETSPRPHSPLATPPLPTPSIAAVVSPPQSAAPPPPPPQPDNDAELQELRARIRTLEAQRAEAGQRNAYLEGRLAEAETFVAIKPKLQAKLTSLQTELLDMKRELHDSRELAKLSESRVIDAQEQLEMVMLDKEVAEERAELAEAELDDMKEKYAILEVENDVLKAEGNEAIENPVAKDSMAYIQLEKQNERLKEALIKLRDITTETDQEQRRRISEMERDVSGLEELQASYDESLIKLANAETQIEDLKLQLDDALAAEDMLVQLTERNLMLGEKIEDMRITIEDLEALKELSDELEENHMETEKQLHEDLEAKDAAIREHARKIELLEETCLDYENTIQQFRDLVLQLQTELDQLRTQTQNAQVESASAVTQAANVMSMNLRLQSSAQKNQTKTIDLEVKSIEAKECKELLAIITPYLPQLYVESDMAATNCYLLFRRLGFKADLINTVVSQINNLPEALNGDVTGPLVGVCEMRRGICGVASQCKRFAAVLRSCSVDDFLNSGHLYPEIAHFEKRIDMHIDLLRRNEFRAIECVQDMQSIEKQFYSLYSRPEFAQLEMELTESGLGYITEFEYDLDQVIATIGFLRTTVTALMKDEDAEVDTSGVNVDADLLDPTAVLLKKTKAIKNLSRKLLQRLETLAQSSSAMKPAVIAQFYKLNRECGALVDFGIGVVSRASEYEKEARSTEKPFHFSRVMAIIEDLKPGLMKEDKSANNGLEAAANFVNAVAEKTSKLLQLASEAESVQKVTVHPPWVARISEIKEALAVNVEAERKVASLNDEMQGLARSLRAKDQVIQESGVKIELMERRLEAAKKQADAIAKLESDIEKARKQERQYEEAIEQLQADLDKLEQDNAKLKTMTAGQERQAAGPQQPEVEHVPIEGSLETSYLLEQIEALRGTIRFLRTENSYLKGHDLLREIESLPPLPQRPARMPTPALVKSTDSDTSDSDLDETPPPPTLFSLSTETKKLYRDVMQYSSAPRVVDLSELNALRAEAKGGKVWLPKKKMPAQQVLERKMEGERLSRRVHGLLERASALGASL